MKYDAFISYRRKTGFLMAQVLKELLKEKGVNCFLDLEQERSGQFDENLFIAIEESANFILVLTNGTLERCANEDDWVRREFLKAMKLNKNIIPVRYPDFEFPQDKAVLEKLPDEIKMLDTKQGVLLSQEYLPATIDKIRGYLKNVTEPFSELQQTEIFFCKGLRRVESPCCVDMAFHAGTEWRRDSDKVDILADIIERNIKLRVIVNESKTVEKVCAHMRQPLKKYVSFDSIAMEWVELSKQFPENIEVHIADIPLLYRLYIIRGKNDGIANVKFYTYGNYRPGKDFRIAFNSADPEYKIYTDEFDYIWSHASHVCDEDL